MRWRWPISGPQVSGPGFCAPGSLSRPRPGSVCRVLLGTDGDSCPGELAWAGTVQLVRAEPSASALGHPVLVVSVGCFRGSRGGPEGTGPQWTWSFWPLLPGVSEVWGACMYIQPVSCSPEWMPPCRKPGVVVAAVDWDPAGGTPPRAAGVKATAEWYVTGGPGVQDAESSRMAAGPSLRAEQQSGGPWVPDVGRSCSPAAFPS